MGGIPEVCLQPNGSQARQASLVPSSIHTCLPWGNTSRTIPSNPPIYAGILSNGPRRVLTMVPSASFGSRFQVLAEFGSRALKGNGKSGPNRNGRGSPKLRRRAILSPTAASQRVYEVRSVPANPFDNTENSVPVRAVSLVRNGDDGGGNATGIEPPLGRKVLILSKYLSLMDSTCAFNTASVLHGDAV
jgi:hypothetical protein